MILRACHRQCCSCAAATSRAGACQPPRFTAPSRRLVSRRPQPCAKSLHNPNPLASCRRRGICSLAAAAPAEPQVIPQNTSLQRTSGCTLHKLKAALHLRGQGRSFNPGGAQFIFCFATASRHKRRRWDHICAVPFCTCERVNPEAGELNCAIICAAIFKRFNVVSSAYSALKRRRSRRHVDGNLCSTRIR